MTEVHVGDADRRDCPNCGKEGMAAAIRCGYCWTKLTPLLPGSAGTRVAGPAVHGAASVIDESRRRDCPVCGRRIMAEATTCGFCWTKVAPVTALAA